MVSIPSLTLLPWKKMPSSLCHLTIPWHIACFAIYPIVAVSNSLPFISMFIVTFALLIKPFPSKIVSYLLPMFFIIILQNSYMSEFFLLKTVICQNFSCLKSLQVINVLSQYPIPTSFRLLFLALLIHLPSSIVSQNTDFHTDHFLSYLLFFQRNGTSYRSRMLAKN